MLIAFVVAVAAAAAAETTGSDPTVAIIGAIGALIVAILGALGVFVNTANTRADKLSGESRSVMQQRVDDALAGEEQMRRERDEARAETVTANRDRDRWMSLWSDEQSRANKLEVRLAVCEQQNTRDRNGEGQ